MHPTARPTLVNHLCFLYSITGRGEQFQGPAHSSVNFRRVGFLVVWALERINYDVVVWGGIMLFKCFILFLFLQLYIFWVDTKFWLTGFDDILNLFSLHITAKRQVFLMRKHTVFPCPRGSGCLHGVSSLSHASFSICLCLIFSTMFFPSNSFSPVSLSYSHILAFLWWFESLHSPQTLPLSVKPISLTPHNYTLWRSNSIQFGQESFSTDAYLNYKMCTSLSSGNPAYRQMTVFKYHLIQW